jgi:hypothetical protein
VAENVLEDPIADGLRGLSSEHPEFGVVDERATALNDVGKAI